LFFNFTNDPQVALLDFFKDTEKVSMTFFSGFKKNSNIFHCLYHFGKDGCSFGVIHQNKQDTGVNVLFYIYTCF